MLNTRIVFVINDFHAHGGHVKSFITQFSALRDLAYSYHVICTKDGYIQLNPNLFCLPRHQVTYYSLGNLPKWQFQLHLYQKVKDTLDENTILHIYSSECYFSALLAKAHFKKIKIVLSQMGGPNPFPYLASMDMYIAVSKEQLNYALVNSNTSNYERRTTIIKNRIKVDKSLTRLNSNASDRLVLVVSRFDRQKEASLKLIRAIVFNLPTDIRVVFAGSGGLLEEYRQSFFEFQNVEFIGYCSDLHVYISSASVVLGMGRSILEFMLHGVPAILVGHSGIQLLDNLHAVMYASDFNFSGRSIIGEVTPETAALSIRELFYQKKIVNKSIIRFLEDEYSEAGFEKKYFSAMQQSSISKISFYSFIYEYIFIFIKRFKRCFRHCLKTEILNFK